MIIDKSTRSFPRKKSEEMMLLLVRQSVAKRVFTTRLTRSALIRMDPRCKMISKMWGVVCAMAENIGERACGLGEFAIALSKN